LAQLFVLYLVKSIKFVSNIIEMKKAFRILLITTALTGVLLPSFADRGIGKKKNKVILNIKTPTTFASSLKFNLRNGMKYTGSSLLKPLGITKTTALNSFNTLVTYQKGKSIYIVPMKQKVLVADVKQGYTGAKLIIRIK
jgi:hypothetical protein